MDDQTKVKANRTKIGKYVRSRRVQAGLTLRQLSGPTGLTSTLPYNVECGISDPKFTTLEKLANGFVQLLPKFLRRFYLRAN
jgi:transcriptional regulator with XRE-family HTH domain